MPLLAQSPPNQSHPSIDAIVHDILAAQRSTGTTYALFTDGSFQLGDLPTGLILESEHMRRSYGNASGRSYYLIAALVLPWSQVLALVVQATIVNN